jgi:hypothetical protein
LTKLVEKQKDFKGLLKINIGNKITSSWDRIDDPDMFQMLVTPLYGIAGNIQLDAKFIDGRHAVSYLDIAIFNLAYDAVGYLQEFRSD